MLSFEQIKELLELVASHRLQGLELERSGFRLKISGLEPSSTPPSLAAGAAPASVRAPLDARAGLPATPPGEPPVGTGEEVPDDVHVLTSPIVGTFYTAPSPDAEPYVRVGDRVRKGQVLCIVEAMKLMNEIEADADGLILRAFPRNAQPVEYGEPLFAIQAD